MAATCHQNKTANLMRQDTQKINREVRTKALCPFYRFILNGSSAYSAQSQVIMFRLLSPDKQTRAAQKADRKSRATHFSRAVNSENVSMC